MAGVVWGPPRVWQGWVVIAIFALSVLAGAVFLLPSHGQRAFVAYSALPCALLIVAAWARREPPGWPWGGK